MNRLAQYEKALYFPRYACLGKYGGVKKTLSGPSLYKCYSTVLLKLKDEN